MIWTILPAIAIATILWHCRSIILLRLMRTILYRLVMRYIMPHARISCCHADMTTEKYHGALAKLHRGDIVLTTDKRSLSTLCVPGEHTHALLCIGRLFDVCAEMTHKGYGEIAFGEACFHASRVVVLRCPAWDAIYTERVIEKCRSFKGARYDIQFDENPDDGDTYCSQLPWAADIEHRLNVIPSRAWGTRQLVVTPDDLAASNVEVIYDSDGEDKPTTWLRPWKRRAD